MAESFPKLMEKINLHFTEPLLTPSKIKIKEIYFKSVQRDT